jgi:hypothetical protein
MLPISMLIRPCASTDESSAPPNNRLKTDVPHRLLPRMSSVKEMSFKLISKQRAACFSSSIRTSHCLSWLVIAKWLSLHLGPLETLPSTMRHHLYLDHTIPQPSPLIQPHLHHHFSALSHRRPVRSGQQISLTPLPNQLCRSNQAIAQIQLWQSPAFAQVSCHNVPIPNPLMAVQLSRTDRPMAPISFPRLLRVTSAQQKTALSPLHQPRDKGLSSFENRHNLPLRSFLLCLILSSLPMGVTRLILERLGTFYVELRKHLVLVRLLLHHVVRHPDLPSLLESTGETIVTRVLRNSEKPEPQELPASKQPVTPGQQLPVEQVQSSTAECVACCTDVPRVKSHSDSCGHSWCSKCVNRMFRRAVYDNSLWPPQCCKVEMPIEKMEQFLTGDLIPSVKVRQVEMSVPILERIYCANCTAFIPHEGIHEGTASCHKCWRSTCTTCKEKAHVGDCQYRFEQGLKDLETLAEKEGWKKCSTCLMIIDNNGGCSRMM